MMNGLSPAAGGLTGCLLITHFPAKAERQRRPDLGGRLFAVTAEQPGGALVLDFSEPAAGRVKVGQPVSAALASVPDLQLLPEDRLYLDSVQAELQAALLTVMDRVEPAGRGCWHLDLSGMAALYGGLPGLAAAVLELFPPCWRPRLGIAASGKFPAGLAARRAESGSWLSAPLADWELCQWLSNFPISALPLEPSALARLREFGWRTLGAVAAVGERELVDFLGPEGSRIRRLCRGEDYAPVQPVVLPERHSRRLAFPWPVDGAPGLLAAVRSLCDGLWATAPLAGRTVGSAALEGDLLEGGVWRWARELRFPAGSSQALYSALQSGLSAQDRRGRSPLPAGPLTGLTLTASGLQGERGRQEGLEKAVGESRVRSLVTIAGVERLAPLDPASPVPERRWVLGTSRKALAEPAEVAVECAAGAPRWVGYPGPATGGQLLLEDSDRREVSQILDCWELETGWWSPDPVARRYWALALADGGLMTIYQDRLSGSWFRQGG